MGPNNSGKSTIFKGLNLIRTIPFSGGGINWNRPGYYSLEGFVSSVYAHDQNREIKISADYEINGDIYRSDFGFNGKISINQFLRNGEGVSDLSSTAHRNVASTVWYVAPNRANIPYQTRIGQDPDQMQGLSPSGSNVNDFLVKKFTSKDDNWEYAEKWLKEIDENMIGLKTPISGNAVSTVTSRTDTSSTTEVNINLQGNGVQNAAIIIAAVVFSPPGSTIIIEEPEAFLHHKGKEVLMDLFNDVIQKFSKQIIILTHSWHIVSRFAADLQNKPPTGNSHYVKTDPTGFKFYMISNKLGDNKISELKLGDETGFGKLWDELSKINVIG